MGNERTTLTMATRWGRSPGGRGISPSAGAAALALVVALGLAVSAARASQTAPALGLTAATLVTGSGGILLVLDADFPQADAVQQEIEIQIFLREAMPSARFLRAPLTGGALRAEVEALASSGLDAQTVDAVLSATGTPVAVEVAHLGPRRIELLLPPGFPEGAAQAQLFMIYRGEPLFSNPVAVGGS